MKFPHGSPVRPTPRSLAYVAAICALAAMGFISQSPWPILLAALLAAPTSLIAVPCYYVLYGLVALFPEANPSSGAGSGTVATDGTTSSSVSTGSAAGSFTTTTHALGIIALTAAAILNVLLVRTLIARRQRATAVPASAPVPGDTRHRAIQSSAHSARSAGWFSSAGRRWESVAMPRA